MTNGLIFFIDEFAHRIYLDEMMIKTEIEKIEKKMEGTDKSMRQLCLSANMYEQTVWKWKTGRRMPRMDNWNKFLAAAKVYLSN